MSSTLNNRDLVQRIAKDDIKAFKEVYEFHSKKMLLYANNILKNTAVSEDIVQNIFIDLWSKRATNKIENLTSYLLRAVKFQIFKYFRDQKFYEEGLFRLNIIDISINASQKMEFQELENSINKYVAQLPPRCKEVFELSRFDHKSNKEIAELLGISIQAVKNQITKSLSYIRANLKDDGLVFYFLVLFLII
jgi:RNA polymerase sigma-70 factor (family 1)